MIKAILAICLALSIAAALVFAAKLAEAKQAIWDERSVHLSEYKAVVHDRDILLEGSRKDMEIIRELEQELSRSKANFTAALDGNRALQDRLSEIICPRNDHVWQDGICTKCGRQKDERAD